MRKVYLVTGIVLFFLQFSAAQHTPARKGVVDLSNYNWDNGAVTLSGEWEFYWNEYKDPQTFDTSSLQPKNYIAVPSFWNTATKTNTAFGFATYRLLVNCPKGNEELSLKLLTIEAAYRLYVNGKEVAHVGKAGTNEPSTVPELKPLVVNVTPLHDQLDIVLQVANFHNRVGGVWDFIKLGTRTQIRELYTQNLALELFIAGCFFIACIYYFILFNFFRKNYALLCFSILCLIIFCRSLSVGEMPLVTVLHAGWALARRVEYITLFASVPVMSLFSFFLFPNEFSKKILYIIIGVCTAFLLVSVFAGYYTYTYLVRYYQALMIITALYGFAVYIKAAIRKRPGSLLFLSGFIIFLVTIINDILYANLLVHTIPLFYAGLFLFIITLSILLSGQFRKNFSDLQTANAKLLSFNNELEKMHQKVSEKNDELEKINYELDAFVNRTSHDLKVPITSVLGIAYMLREEVPTTASKELLTVQEKILKRMTGMIKDIIDFSKNKRLELELKEIDFATLVNDSLEDHSHADKSEQIEKIVQINQYEAFVSDERRLRIIINNLVSNAIKYCDFHKPNPSVSIVVNVQNNVANIKVSDNGIGIEEQHLDKIFTLFYRATESTTGSGLGLYIVKETVEKLSGLITISSIKGDGTTINISLPDKSHQQYKQD